MEKIKVGSKRATSLSAKDYVHLHNHTQYSLLDGLTKIPALADKVSKLGMEAVAITDHGTLSGVIEFYKDTKSKDIKPIIGIETYVAPRTIGDKDPTHDKANYHLILLAMNNVGYQNLMQLSTLANLDGFYYRPRIDHRLLETYNEGIIALSGCIGGEVGDLLRQNQYEQAKKVAEWYKSVFGDRYYIEVQDHGHPDHPSKWDEQVDVNSRLLKLSDELYIPAVVTCDAHYLNHEDQEAHEILLCVQTGSFLTDEKRMSLKEFELHVTNPKDIIKRWGKDHPELISNTKAIADRCDVNIELNKILIPKFPVPRGETESSFLNIQVYRGLAWRYGDKTEPKAKKMSLEQCKKILPKEIAERASYEMGVINDMGFNGYFLIISDFINWGKAKGIVFGPGRGSAAGSIIAYALKITELDPLKYDLLFERFLNPDRVSMPDIDIDIQDSRRDEVIQYCVGKYGEDRVANIVTFGRMAARNAVRDVARVLQVPYAESDRIAKMIPPPIQGMHTPLSVSLKKNKELKEEYTQNPTARKVFDLAVQMEGTIRSHGVHAAGVVIAPDDIVKFVPLEMAQKGVVATQYSMGPIEELGLLKIDFLGLSNLTTIKNALRIIKRVYGDDIDIDNIPLDDKETFELLTRGDTTGVFQFESAGMKRYLKELKPTEFEDIVAMGALYRPGPMQFIDDFIGRKRGKREITYPHPSMTESLKTTYGVLVYQEQVMQISKDVAGFTGGEADTLRKAIGKKNLKLMGQMKEKMIDGAKKHSNINRPFMEKFWKQLEDFAAYCFNKSHAACYALISYQTAYLKAHYPSAFMAALLTSDYDNIDRLSIEINECQHIGIEVLPPDVNESFLEFAVIPGDVPQIRFGMRAIKNVGSGAVDDILRAREIDGPFTSIEDFFSKINPRSVNRKALESLIKAGALDRFGDRAMLLGNLDVLMAYANRFQKEQTNGQTDLFGNLLEDNQVKPKLALNVDIIKSDGREQLQWERELLGIYLSQHPLEEYKAYLKQKTTSLKDLKAELDGKTITVGGFISDSREITTRNGAKMAFIKLEDTDAQTELVIFPAIYQKSSEMWKRDQVILVKGKVSMRNGEVKVTVDEAVVIKPEDATTVKTVGEEVNIPSVVSRVYVRLNDTSDQKMLVSLKQTIDNFRGPSEVVLVLGPGSEKQAIKLPSGINLAEEDAIDQLKLLVGVDNVKIK
jgi:DNA polymerase-3 subunit alpha